MKKNEIKINILSDPTALDPRKGRDLNERILACMLFDGLTRIGKEGGAILALARDVSVSQDGTQYTFCLKEAYWTNGDRILPSDFIYAWQKVVSKDFLSENAYQLFCLQNAKEIKQGTKPSSSLGAVQIDENTLQVNLIKPIPYFLELLALPIFFPVNEKMDEAGSEWDLKKCRLISCGPFSLKEWRHNDFIEVVKNNSYWDSESVFLSSIYMTMVGEETEIRMFENKELDWAGSPISTLSLDLLKSLKEEGLLSSFPLLATSFFRVNVESIPFHNVNIRKAFALAIDRKMLVDHVMQGDQQVALRLVPNLKNAYFQDGNRLDTKKEAVAFFQKGLKELSLLKEDFPKVVFLYASNQKNHLIAQAVQQNWKEVLGIEVALEASEPKVYYNRLRKQDYQIAASSWVADYNDPENFLEVFKYKNGSTNNTQWENKEYIKLLDLSRGQGSQERRETFIQCETLLMEEMPIIPIYHLNGLFLQNKLLKEVTVSPTGNLDFKWAYLDNSN